MKKKLLTLMGSICLALVLVALLLPACAKEEAPVAPTPARPSPVAPAPVTPTPAPAGWEWPKTLMIIGKMIGTSSYAQTTAWAPVMEKSTGMKVRVTPEALEQLRYEILCKGEYDMGSGCGGDVAPYYAGEGGAVDMEKGQTRGLWYMLDMAFGFAVRGDSRLKTIYDIRDMEGVKVSVNAASAGMVLQIKGLLAFLGITEKDVTLVPVGGYTANVRTIVEGKADVCVAGAGSSVTYEIEGSPKGIRWLDMPLEDKEGWKGFLKWRTTSVPGKMAWGVPSAMGHEGWITSFMYWVSADMDEELAYHLAKWFDENYDAYKGTHPNNARMTIDSFRSYLDFNPFPIHDGVIRYLKERGKWTAKDDAWNEENVAFMTNCVEAWEGATAEAKAKGIKIDFENKEWVDFWAEYTKDLPRFATRLE